MEPGPPDLLTSLTFSVTPEIITQLQRSNRNKAMKGEKVACDLGYRENAKPFLSAALEVL